MTFKRLIVTIWVFIVGLLITAIMFFASQVSAQEMAFFEIKAVDNYFDKNVTEPVHNELSSSNKIIVLDFRSEGGNIQKAEGLIMLVEEHPDRFWCFNQEKAFSAAFLIYISCKHRFSKPDAEFMWHKITTQFREGVSWTPEDLRKEADRVDNMQEKWDKRVSQVLRAPLAMVHDYRDNETRFKASRFYGLTTEQGVSNENSTSNLRFSVPHPAGNSND